MLNENENAFPAWLGTCSGKKFWPLEPVAADVCIEDIAHGLAYKYRFAGQSVRGYTVAQHSIQVAVRVPPADARWGLLHDAAEAYLCDVPSPIKKRMYVVVDRTEGTEPYQATIPFKIVERTLLLAIAERFGLPWPMPQSVKIVDDQELARERRELFDERQPEWPGLTATPSDDTIYICHPPDYIEAEFLRWFRKLWSE